MALTTAYTLQLADRVRIGQTISTIKKIRFGDRVRLVLGENKPTNIEVTNLSTDALQAGPLGVN